ncbi:MAG TPA: hypothetical protein VJR94_12925 [Candidatus Nitrosocosmicus sp.]|nr:hypothetical protein [Candidatus Nitrosocosmicus sp.]
MSIFNTTANSTVDDIKINSVELLVIFIPGTNLVINKGKISVV